MGIVLTFEVSVSLTTLEGSRDQNLREGQKVPPYKLCKVGLTISKLLQM